MLDLNKLEEKLDNALANETESSLKNWLMSKRASCIKNLVCGFNPNKFSEKFEMSK